MIAIWMYLCFAWSKAIDVHKIHINSYESQFNNKRLRFIIFFTPTICLDKVKCIKQLAELTNLQHVLRYNTAG